MKMRHALPLALLPLSGLVGCAGMTLTPQGLNDLPVVAFGGPVPTGTDYVLYFPAGKPIPAHVSIAGNAFQQPAEDTLTVALVRDIYVHKDWVSFDHRMWMKSKDAIRLAFQIKVPGYKYPKDGKMEIRMDLNPNATPK